MISVDTLANGVPLLSGFIDQQTGTFSNASLKGAGVLELNGLASISGALNADVTLGLENASGAGNLSVSYDEYKYQSGHTPKLLDIIDVPLLKAAPHNHQTENHILDPKSSWVKRGELAWDDLEQIREQPESLVEVNWSAPILGRVGRRLDRATSM